MENQTLDATGYNTVGFRPVGGMVAVELSELQIKQFEDEENESRKALKGAEGPPPVKLFIGDEEERRRKERETTYKVAAVSLASLNNIDSPRVGDRITVKSGTLLPELKVNGKTYAVIEMHRVECIFSPDVKVEA